MFCHLNGLSHERHGIANQPIRCAAPCCGCRRYIEKRFACRLGEEDTFYLRLDGCVFLWQRNAFGIRFWRLFRDCEYERKRTITANYAVDRPRLGCSSNGPWPCWNSSRYPRLPSRNAMEKMIQLQRIFSEAVLLLDLLQGLNALTVTSCASSSIHGKKEPARPTSCHNRR
jgi:hypothetical protein